MPIESLHEVCVSPISVSLHLPHAFLRSRVLRWPRALFVLSATCRAAEPPKSIPYVVGMIYKVIHRPREASV